ncbi:MAG: transcriptional repressor [bacterium]|nr:transcriptional repressor [bacterium]
MGITKQKFAIKQAFEESKTHMTAEEVLQKVRQDMPDLNISLATIYRNLNTMAGNGELSRLTFPDGKIRFDKTRELCHIHCYCTECGDVFDVAPESFELLPKVLNDSFLVTGCEIIVKGLCSKCLEKSENAEV